MLFVLPSLGGGGAEMNAVRLAKPLQKRGVSTTYATFSDRNPYREKLDDSAQVVDLATARSRSSTLRKLRGIPSLANTMKERQFDVVVPVLEATTLATVAARRLAQGRTPLVCSVQNAYLRLSHDSTRLRDRALHRLWAFGYGSTDGAIALSHGVAEDLARYVPNLSGRIETVNNVGLTELPASLSRRSDNGPLRLVACGRLEPIKDYPTMLKGVAEAGARIDLRLDILGDGPERSDLEKLVFDLGLADRVTFHGFVNDPDRIMGQSDIFLLTSLSEGFGNVIVEAMALGVPVIATDCPYGPREITRNGEYGMLIPVGDEKALSGAISTLADNSVRRRELSASGRCRAGDFTAEVIGEKFYGALVSLVEKASRR